MEDAHPAIVSKRDFQRARRLLGSRAPKKVNPRRASSPYLLSGIAKCETCGKAMTAAEAKSGKYTHYICHSLLKRGKGTCKTPRLNAKNFEKIIVDELRANILTESNIRDLVKLLDEEMDGVARDQRERLQTIEEELEDVKRRLARIWNHIETTDTEMADASDRIREHRERKEKLEIAAGEARALLSERRQFLDSADTIATFAAEMSEFLKTSELTETRAFVHSFVKEVEVKPGKAAIVYSIPTPEDSPIGGADAAEVALNGRVRSTVQSGGPVPSGGLVGPVRCGDRGHGVHRRVLDTPVRGAGRAGLPGDAGGPQTHQERAWSQDRRAGLPVAAATAHLRPAVGGLPSRWGYPDAYAVTCGSGPCWWSTRPNISSTCRKP